MRHKVILPFVLRKRISKNIFNANYQFSKDLGIIWYTFNNKRKCIVLWGIEV